MSISKKSVTRFILIILILALMIPMMTGCGHEGPGKTKKSYTSGTTSLPEDFVGNESLVSWNGKNLTVMDSSGKQVAFDGPIHATVIKAKDVNGKKPGNYFFREIAAFMYASSFGEKYIDPFIEGKYDPITLEPLKVINAVNEATANQVTSQASGGVLSATLTHIKGAAAAILIAVWSMGFISQIVNERFSMDTLLKTFMQLMCGILIVVNAETIALAFFNTGNEMLTQIASNGQANQFGGFKTFIHDELNSMHVWNIGICMPNLFALPLGTIYFDLPSVMVIVYLLLPVIAQVLCAYKIISMMIMRMLELIVRIAFAAIPIAFGAQNGFGPETIRYFRGVMACALQPVLMMVGVLLMDSICAAAMSIADGVEASGLVGSFVMTIAYFVLSAYLGETKQLAQDIIAR